LWPSFGSFCVTFTLILHLSVTIWCPFEVILCRFSWIFDPFFFIYSAVSCFDIFVQSCLFATLIYVSLWLLYVKFRQVCVTLLASCLFVMIFNLFMVGVPIYLSLLCHNFVIFCVSSWLFWFFSCGNCFIVVVLCRILVIFLMLWSFCIFCVSLWGPDESLFSFLCNNVVILSLCGHSMTFLLHLVFFF